VDVVDVLEIYGQALRLIGQRFKLMYRSLVKRLSSSLPAFGKPAVIILCYHRVASERNEWLNVYPDEDGFRWRMQAIQDLVPIEDLESSLDALSQGVLGRTVAAVTFDDGYKDNIDVAFPILRELGIPATFFISTGFLGSKGLIGERLRQAFVTTRESQLMVPELQDKPFTWSDNGGRMETMKQVNQVLKYMPWRDRERLADIIVEQLSSADDGSGMMTTADLVTLDAAGMKIGCHSHMHLIGSLVSDEEFSRDLETSKLVLATTLKKPITMFAYPNGKAPKDYHPRHLSLVAEAGFRYGITTNTAIVKPGFDPFSVPRFTPWDSNRLKFTLRVVAAQQFGV
jgi:peptidoglycan/xylan/chitin deacetylase (PgdA/CDA1 family)